MVKISNISVTGLRGVRNNITIPLDSKSALFYGDNGSGKSTIVASASRVFFNLPMKEYFGDTVDGAMIEFELDGNKRSWHKKGKSWFQKHWSLQTPMDQ